MPIEIITDEDELLRAGFRWREHEGVRALVCAPLEADGFANAFSTRAGGASMMPRDALNLAGFNEDDAANINENRRRFLKLFDGDWTLATAWQVHGADVCVFKDAEDAARRRDERCDALATRAARVLLGVQTADCVPVVIGDARGGACAAIHAGWRGTLSGIVGRALELLGEEFGTRAGEVRAAIGPAARACCYEVGREVIDAFNQRFDYAGELFTPTREGHALVDLHRANRRQLADAGVAPERIHTAPFCTMCRTDLFFSYRREKIVHGRTGRLLAVIGKKQMSDVGG